MKVLVVNGNRFLINEKSKAVDKSCEEILKNYPPDATIEVDEVKLSDVL